MLTGSKVVFDEIVHGTTATYTGYHLADELGRPDRLAIEATTDTVTGTTPTLTVAIEASADGRNWVQKNGTAEINAVSISASQTTTAIGGDTGASPTGALVRLKVQLGGTGTVMAHVRLTVASRDRLGRPARIAGPTRDARFGLAAGTVPADQASPVFGPNQAAPPHPGGYSPSATGAWRPNGVIRR